MKLSSKHFLQNDAYHADSLRDLAHLLLNDLNFGLLPATEGMRSSLEYDLSPNRDRFEVILLSCNAITRGGVRILQNPAQHNKQAASASVLASEYAGQDEATLAVIITANPFVRIPVGEPDPEETPLRHPNTSPSLRLEIVPESTINLNYLNAYYLVIGRIAWRDKQFIWDEDYIPACTSTTAHPSLREAYEEFDQLQNGLRRNAIAIMDLMQQRQAQSRPDYDLQLAKNTAKLCEQMIQHLADTSFTFKNTIRSAAPIELVEQICRLAGRLFATLNLIPATDRERLLAYYSQWTGINPFAFQQNLSKLIDLQYDHLNIRESLNAVATFLRMVANLWGNLSKLEFLGKLENNLVIGIESEYRSNTTTRHSLLD